MKNRVLIMLVLSVFMFLGTTEKTHAQFGSFIKKALNKKKKTESKKRMVEQVYNARKKKSKSTSSGAKAGAFSDFNNVSDPYGVSGEYVDIADKDVQGFKFVAEDGGKVVNQLHYFGKNKNNPEFKLNFKESYYRKKQVKLFFMWNSSYAKSYIELLEVAPGVLAQMQQTQRSINSYDESVPLEVERKVINVFVKNTADFDTWDMETAQAKADMILSSLQSAKFEKDRKKLMRFEAYKNYHGKIAFAKYPSALRSSNDKQPVEEVSGFITKRELGETVGFKPYLDQPLAASHPGAWFNITYEMAGVTTDREVLRKTSSKFSKKIPRLDRWLNDFYFYYPKVTIDRSNNYSDYAFLELLRLTQDKLQKGKTYDLKVTVWAHKDGQNLDPVSKGTIQLEYTANTDKLLNDPVSGWITKIEDYLDE